MATLTWLKCYRLLRRRPFNFAELDGHFFCLLLQIIRRNHSTSHNSLYVSSTTAKVVIRSTCITAQIITVKNIGKSSCSISITLLSESNIDSSAHYQKAMLSRREPHPFTPRSICASQSFRTLVGHGAFAPMPLFKTVRALLTHTAFHFML